VLRSIRAATRKGLVVGAGQVGVIPAVHRDASHQAAENGIVCGKRHEHMIVLGIGRHRMRAPGGVPWRRSQKRGYPRHIKCRHDLVEELARPVDHPEEPGPLIRGRERAPSTGHSMRRIWGVLGTGVPVIVTGIVPDLVRGADAA
jgi:hypothetical protein